VFIVLIIILNTGPTGYDATTGRTVRPVYTGSHRDMCILFIMYYKTSILKTREDLLETMRLKLIEWSVTNNEKWIKSMYTVMFPNLIFPV